MTACGQWSSADDAVISSPHCDTTFLDRDTHNNNSRASNPNFYGPMVRINGSAKGPGRIGLLRFHFLKTFPAGVAKVRSASLRLFFVGPDRGSRMIQFHRVTGDWSQSDGDQLPARNGVDWFCRRHPHQQWKTPGGDYAPNPVKTIVVEKQSGELVMDIELPPEEVEFAISHPSEHFGWALIQPNNPLETAFCSAFNQPERCPRLTIRYEPAPPGTPELNVSEPEDIFPYYIDLELPRAGKASLAVYDKTGRMVRMLGFDSPFHSGWQRIGWDGCDDNGNKLPQGPYTLKMLMGDTVKARYVATVGNGRYPSKSGDVGGLHGQRLKDVQVDSQGDIYILGTGHGRNGQRLSPEGKVVWTYRMLWDESGTAFTLDEGKLDERTLYVVGPKNWWRINGDNGTLEAFSDQQRYVALGPEKPVELDHHDSQVQRYLAPTRKSNTIASDFVIDAADQIDGTMGKTSGDRARGIAVLGDHVYISLFFENEVLKYHKKTGELVATWPNIFRPSGITADSDGTLVLLVGQQLQRYDRHGQKLAVIVEEGLSDPRDVAVGPRGYYVTDLGWPNRLVVISRDGRILDTYGQRGGFNGTVSAEKLYIPLGLDVDSEGNIFLAEYHLYRLLNLNPDLSVRQTIAGGLYAENVCVDRQDPTRMYALVGYDLSSLREFEFDYEIGVWNWNRFWLLDSQHPTRTVWGFNVCGSKLWTIAGQRLYYNVFKSVRVFNIKGDDLRPVAWLGGRFRITDTEGQTVPFQGNWPLWTDRNNDGLAQENEVSYLPEAKKWHKQPHIQFSVDGDIAADGTIYYGNFALPLEEIDANGVPNYSWETAEVVGPDFANMPPNSIREGVAIDEEKNRYFSLQYHDGNASTQPGVSLKLGGHWARNTIDAKLEKWSPDDRRLWRIGSRATGYCYPGEFYHPSGIDYAGGYVFVNDEPGIVHIYDPDGLFVAMLLKDPFRNKIRPVYYSEGRLPLMSPTVGEFWQMDTFVHPQTGRTYIVCQSHEGGGWMRIYEVVGLDGVIKMTTSLELQ